MAKKKSFDPDALAKAGQAIVKKHQLREQYSPSTESEPKPIVAKKIEVVPTPVPSKKEKKENEKTQLCRVGISYHRRVKLAAIKKDMTIRQYLEALIDKHVPAE